MGAYQLLTYNDSIRRSIVALCYGPETFLSCCVPYLELVKGYVDLLPTSFVNHPFILIYLDSLSIDIHSFHGKVNANCWSVFFYKLTCFESLRNTSFARATITNQHYLEQEVKHVVLGGHGHQRLWIPGHCKEEIVNNAGKATPNSWFYVEIKGVCIG